MGSHCGASGTSGLIVRRPCQDLSESKRPVLLGESCMWGAVLEHTFYIFTSKSVYIMILQYPIQLLIENNARFSHSAACCAGLCVLDEFRRICKEGDILGGPQNSTWNYVAYSRRPKPNCVEFARCHKTIRAAFVAGDPSRTRPVDWGASEKIMDAVAKSWDRAWPRREAERVQPKVSQAV